MDFILSMRDLIAALRARDFKAARKPAAKLLRLVADQLDGPAVIGDSAEFAAALAELQAAVGEVGNDTPAVYGAGGEYLKTILAALLTLLPLLL